VFLKLVNFYLLFDETKRSEFVKKLNQCTKMYHLNLMSMCVGVVVQLAKYCYLKGISILQSMNYILFYFIEYL
jgi:hypothetical protein